MDTGPFVRKRYRAGCANDFLRSVRAWQQLEPGELQWARVTIVDRLPLWVILPGSALAATVTACPEYRHDVLAKKFEYGSLIQTLP